MKEKKHKFPGLFEIKHAQEDVHVLCGYCNKQIHVKDFGGMSKEVGMFHMNCYMKNTSWFKKETI